MKHRITLEVAVNFINIAIKPLSCWPPAEGSSRLAHIRHNLLLGIILSHLGANLVSSIYTLYQYRHNPSEFIKVLSETSCLVMTPARMIILKLKTREFKDLMDGVQRFLDHATREEKELLQSYVDKCLTPHLIFFTSIVIGASAFVTAPIITKEPRPANIIYPFSTEAIWIWALLYISQSICILQIALCCYLDVFCAILLWYTGARFDMLAMELQSATNDKDVHRCVWKHQQLIQYVAEMRMCIRMVAVSVVATTMITVSAGGFILIRGLPPYEFAKYVCYELASAMELFMFTWPADNLIDTSGKLADAAYNCDWIGKSSQMHKDLLILIERSQSPLYIAVDGLLPILSLELYGSTLMTAFSYLTTLRAVAGE